MTEVKVIEVWEVAGKRFDDVHDAQEYAVLCTQVDEAMAPLGPRNNDTAFLNGKGYTQHKPEDVEKVRAAVDAIAMKKYPTCKHTNMLSRYAGDSGDSCLNRAYFRLACIARNDCEYGQPYYADHPWEAK